MEHQAIATTLVALLTLVVSFLAFDNSAIEDKYLFRPDAILAGKEYHRLLTSGFLHAGWAHLLVNMYTLYGFGGSVEMIYGKGGFLVIYFGSIVGGNLLSLYLHRYHDYAALGASGGVCGLIFAHILYQPASMMGVFPFPYRVPGWLYAILFLIVSVYALKRASDNIGHDAHVGGAMLGLVVAALLQPELARQHWRPMTAMLLVSGVIFVYLWKNPMFLPLTSFIQLPVWGSRQARARPAQRKRAPSARATSLSQATAPNRDWLIQELELHLGPLRKDQTGAHDWLDKFDRTYDVMVGAPDTFNPESYCAEVLERLNRPGVNFLIVDTRQLREAQVNAVRPFFANLPDREFNRVIRSFAFKQPQG